jgi:hypothetical protein
MPEVNLTRQNHLKNLKPLKMVVFSFYDGIPLKFKKKNGRASSLPAQII